MEDALKWWWGRPGFYDRPVENGIEITAEYRDELLRGQEDGYEITSDANGYPVLIEPGPKTLDEWREVKLMEITEHDGSEAVNSFSIGGVSLWWDKTTRASLAARVEAITSAGETVATLWCGSQPPVPVEMPVGEARAMLARIEAYAAETFNVTQRHRVAVYSIDSVEELKAYDHTAGYPDKLRF